jgi:hypothetical protein
MYLLRHHFVNELATRMTRLAPQGSGTKIAGMTIAMMRIWTHFKEMLYPIHEPLLFFLSNEIPPK